MYVGTIMTNEIISLGSENLQQKDQLYTSETKPQVHKHIPELFKTAKIFILKNISIDDRKNELFDYLGNFHIQGWEKNNEGKNRHGSNTAFLHWLSKCQGIM